MSRPAASATPLARAPILNLSNGLCIASLASLAVITLASPGATRMYAWPWSCIYGAALLAPALALVLRAFDRQRPLALPSRPWVALAIATAALVVASALASPYRGQSLLWSAPLLGGIAVFFVAFDWLQGDSANAEKLAPAVGVFFAIVAVASLALWAADLPGRSLEGIVALRNPYPLGHSSYTGALALLALPWFTVRAWRAREAARGAWTICVALALGMLVTSASRGALLGLAALAVVALLVAPIRRKKTLALGFVVAGIALMLAHPRTRAMFTKPDPAAAPNISNVQRSAMLTAAWRMGLDRPWLGWSPGATPLAYPRYRAGLDGGAENVLQLHSAPAQLWAELGFAGVLASLALVVLMLRTAGRYPTAAAALAGYAVFSLTDWQLDVPVFAFAVALCAAFVAPVAENSGRILRASLGLSALLAIAFLALLGQRDPTPQMNVRALVLAREPANADRAIALLRESLALNPDQEIAHFNLGWLLVGRDAAAAEPHFLAAARLVPDKGGVYFGLGLARLKQNRREAAARAFALECLNDPAFLASPWWREPAIAALRDATHAEFSRLAAAAQKKLRAGSWAATQLTRVAALASSLGDVPAGAERSYFRERTGYPVLMRNLDLATPTDLFLVRESVAPPAGALPAKGWLPSPLLLELLDAPAEK